MKMMVIFLKFDFPPEMFGDLLDMFWHHHWCPRNDVDPLTINFVSKKMGQQRRRIIVLSFSADQINQRCHLEPSCTLFDSLVLIFV